MNHERKWPTSSFWPVLASGVDRVASLRRHLTLKAAVGRGVRTAVPRDFVGNVVFGLYERLGGRYLGTEPYDILSARVQTVLCGLSDLSLLSGASVVSLADSTGADSDI
jgi:hypothetical protein